MADAWGENNWGEGFWGQQSSITVSVTGLSTTTALGTESVVADCLVTLDSLQVSTAIGTATGEPEHVISVTPVTFETQLSGVTVGYNHTRSWNRCYCKSNSINNDKCVRHYISNRNSCRNIR